eukprot:355896-Chlamydomonas_euryale.AAC.2
MASRACMKEASAAVTLASARAARTAPVTCAATLAPPPLHHAPAFAAGLLADGAGTSMPVSAGKTTRMPLAFRHSAMEACSAESPAAATRGAHAGAALWPPPPPRRSSAAVAADSVASAASRSGCTATYTVRYASVCRAVPPGACPAGVPSGTEVLEASGPRRIGVTVRPCTKPLLPPLVASTGSML